MGRNGHDGNDELELPGVTTVDIDTYEASYERRVNETLYVQETNLELKRLERVRNGIRRLQNRLETNPHQLPMERMAKLMDRLDEMREEETLILERIKDSSRDALERNSAAAAKEQSIQSTRTESCGVNGAFTTIKPPKYVQSALKKRRRSDVEDALDETMTSSSNEIENSDFFDDGDEDFFRHRLTRWFGDEPTFPKSNIEAFGQPLGQQFINFPSLVSAGMKDMKAPSSIWLKLLDYQKSGVQWMLQLFEQEVGGILGDEMGLGKTVQVIATIATLQTSGKLIKPALIICPATVMKQWIREFHAWWPPLRVVLIHAANTMAKDHHSLIKALDKVMNMGHVIITSYGHLQHRKIGGKLLEQEYGLVILDEGHKIRNPAAAITAKCKEIKTHHRYILSGTPIQNNLIELWSLMDFCCPGRLGMLLVFKAEIAQPIIAGGYIHASSIQVQTAYKCACILKDLISPYLLRRLKMDVALSLPTKREQVLFCQITNYQRVLYEHYVASEDVQAIMCGSKNILAGIDVLRKICNHPALLRLEDDDFNAKRYLTDITTPSEPTEVSGKMKVLDSVLDHWHDSGLHRVLLFCQTRQMLDLIEAFVKSRRYTFLRMDGTTPVSIRATLVDKFNNDPTIFIFLLTTRVGGLGVNLTGADRVIIYDPDWNPSTDMQARERAWRLGQTRPVTIYRMLTVGTIEEKIYHRQIFKQYLTSRILADPKQTRFFKSSDLYDLFTLGTQEMGTSDTNALLEGLVDVKSEEHDPLTATTNDHNVLEGLMRVTGLHSALEHDRFVEKPLREVLLVEREAQKRATEAIEALQRSRELNISSLGRGITTASILASIRRRQLVDDSMTLKGSTASHPSLQKTVDQLLTLFRQNHDKCRSDLIAKTFSYISGEDAIAFRLILKTIATLYDGIWTLKSEFA